MIRKILVLLALFVVVLWLAGAYLIKNRLVLIADNLNSDNTKFSYKDTKISGFPFSWNIEFVSPKLTLIGQKSIHEISSSLLRVEFDYLMQSVEFSLSEMINSRNVSGDCVDEYKFIAEESIVTNVFFSESLYFLNSENELLDYLVSVRSKLPDISVFLNDDEIFNITGIKLITKQKNSELISKTNFKLDGKYESPTNYLQIGQADLSLDLSYLRNNDFSKSGKNFDFERKLNVSKFNLNFDNASLISKGAIKFTKHDLPKGELDISIVQYPYVINKLVPDGMTILGTELKPMLFNAAIANLKEDKSVYDKVDFKVFFSDKGIFSK